MYIQGMAQQTQVFLLCVGFGFIIGAVYDLIRFFRKSFSSGFKAIVVQDIFFFVLCTFSSFLFMLCVNDGELRLYPYLGCIVGFFIWYFTLGVIVRAVLNRLSEIIRIKSRGILMRIKKFNKKTVKFIKKITNKTTKPLEKSIDNSV